MPISVSTLPELREFRGAIGFRSMGVSRVVLVLALVVGALSIARIAERWRLEQLCLDGR
jgi:hypothetical protein